MGVSLRILTVEPFHVDVDISQSIEVTIGTGFNEHGKPSLNVELPTDIIALKAMREDLDEIITGLSNAKLCQDCGYILYECAKCPSCN